MTHTAPRAIPLKRIEKRKHSRVKAGGDGAITTYLQAMSLSSRPCEKHGEKNGCKERKKE